MALKAASTAKDRAMIRLDIFSDPVCPWCLVGKANLDRALESYVEHPFVIQWHPFQLNPEMPEEGVDKASYLAERFGGAQKLQEANDRLRQMAAKAGLDLNPDTPTRIPNTLNSHRLIHWAGLEGVQSLLVSALFRAYWAEGRDIGDTAVLADIAGSVGMDRDVTLRLLNSNADADDIRARDDDARAKGIRAVPSFLVAQHYLVSGAQPPEVWAQIIADLSEKAKA